MIKKHVCSIVLLTCPLYFNLLHVHNVNAQCCSGASPIVIGNVKSVLGKNQLEINGNYQYFESDKTLTGNKKAAFPMFEKIFSNYLYFRTAYGLTDKFTISVELGYHISRTERLLGGFQITGKGIGDLIIFPRYDVFNIINNGNQTELTLGLGAKIPLGDYDQEYVAYENEKTGQRIMLKKSPGIQPSTGTNDFIFSAFLYRAYLKRMLNFYLNYIYIMRGTNPDGVVYGDVMGASLGANKAVRPNIVLGFEVKAEALEIINDPAYLNYKYNSGGRKISIAPQINYVPHERLTFSVFSDFPLYQYVNGTQVASEFLFNFRVTYRLSLSGKVLTETVE